MATHLERSFPDFDTATLPAIPANWIDNSWRNDTCPHWIARAVGEPIESPTLLVYVDYADSALREFSGVYERYTIQLHTSESCEPLMHSDSWESVLVFVDAYQF